MAALVSTSGDMQASSYRYACCCCCCCVPSSQGCASGAVSVDAVGSTKSTERLGLTDFSSFQNLGPDLVKAHCAACSHVLSLLHAADITSSSSPNVRDGAMAAATVLQGFSSLLQVWNDVMPGCPHSPSSGEGCIVGQYHVVTAHRQGCVRPCGYSGVLPAPDMLGANAVWHASAHASVA